MHKSIFILLTQILVFYLIPNSPESAAKIQALREAIVKCNIRGLQGTYNSKICEIQSKFLYPNLLGELNESENFFILHGKTGNGKTTIAQNIANECDAELIEIDNIRLQCNTSDGLTYLESIFQQIELNTNAGKKTILLLDEADGINNYKIQQCLCNFLEKNRNNKNLLIIATTNYFNLLNKKLRNYSGNIIEINAPDFENRKEIIKYFSGIYAKLDALTVERLAKDTDGLSRRALRNIIIHIRQQVFTENKISYEEIKQLIQDEQRAEQIYKEDWKIRALYATGDAIETLANGTGWLLQQYLLYQFESHGNTSNRK